MSNTWKSSQNNLANITEATITVGDETGELLRTVIALSQKKQHTGKKSNLKLVMQVMTQLLSSQEWF